MTKTTKKVTMKEAIAILIGLILFTVMTVAVPIWILWGSLKSKLRGQLIILSQDLIVVLVVNFVMTAITGYLYGKLLCEEIKVIVAVVKKISQLRNEQREEC